VRDYPLDYNQLFNFSDSAPYSAEDNFLSQLDQLKEKYHFPAIRNDIGSFLTWLTTVMKVGQVFEFGSGYGHSAYWFLQNPHLKNIVLTEKRDDLVKEFNNLDWSQRDKMYYHQGDAFEFLQSDDNTYDFALVDGVKADYLKFIEMFKSKLNTGGVLAIDNSYWRGSFLDDEVVAKKASARSIRELHSYIKESDEFTSCFLPYTDGLSLLLKI
jgi:caffeoyl-CoA O-methyltransferase